MNHMTDHHSASTETTVLAAPDTAVDVRSTFGVDVDWQVPAFSKADSRVPDLDEAVAHVDAVTTRGVRDWGGSLLTARAALAIYGPGADAPGVEAIRAGLGG